LASIVVDGLAVPISVAGHPALDFCNTRAGWGDPRPKEYLRGHAHVTVWARENGLIPAAAAARSRRLARDEPVRAEEVVARAVRFRDALRAVLLGPAGRTHWATLDAEVRRAAAATSLTPGPDSGPAGLPARWTVTETSLDLPLLAVAWSAAGFLTAADAPPVAACPGTGCGWIFVDPRRRRRWCSMAWCGNRNKVRRHAERARAARP
jgi:predicted RNA-binding Zn ribbon-like protein